MQVEGKSAVITGGGTGVGRATAIALAKLGCAVAVNYSRSQAEAEETAGELRTLGVRAIAVQGDVASDADCRRIIQAAVDEFGRLDVLVNNAGTTRFIPHERLEDVRDEDWDRILGVNLKGTFQCARAAKPAMEKSGGGAIVNVTSVAGIIATGSSIPYCASKAAINNLTLALARVFAPTIRVNAVAPGFISGRWLENALGEGYAAARDSFASRLPMARVCDPEDVAAAIVSLITGSDLVTGHVMPVEGGFLIGSSNPVSTSRR